MDNTIESLLSSIYESAKRTVDKANDPVLKQVLEQFRTYNQQNPIQEEEIPIPVIPEPIPVQPIPVETKSVKMVRQKPIKTGRTSYVIKFPFNGTIKEVDQDEIVGSEYQVGDMVEIKNDEGSDKFKWEILEVIKQIAYPKQSVFNLPVKGIHYSPFEDTSIQKGGNCLINSLYYAFGYDNSKNIKIHNFTDDILTAFIEKGLEWNDYYDITQSQFRKNVIGHIPMECSFDVVLPYLEKKNKKVKLFTEIDDGICLLKQLIYGNTKKERRYRNLALLTLSDSHIGKADLETNTDRVEKTINFKVPKISKYSPPKSYESITLLTNPTTVIDDIKKFISEKGDQIVKLDYMFYSEPQWIQLIHNIEHHCDKIEYGKRKVIVKRCTAQNNRYLRLQVMLYGTPTNKLSINITNPYSLLNKEGLVLDQDKYLKITTLYNNLLGMFDGCSDRQQKYNSHFNMNLLNFMTENIKSIPRAIIGYIEFKSSIRNTPFSIDLKKAYPSAIKVLSGTYIPKFSVNDNITTNVIPRPYDLVLCQKIDLDGNDFMKGLDSMIVQNNQQLVFKFQLDTYYQMTGRSPYKTLGVLQYSDLVKYDADGKIYEAYKELINQNDKDLKLTGNKMTGMIEKTRQDKFSRLFKSLEDVSAYCNENEIPIKNIKKESVDMGDYIETVYYIKYGTSRIMKSQLNVKMLIHSLINLKIVNECIFLKRNYDASINCIKTDGIKGFVPNEKYQSLVNQYSAPQDKQQFDIIGNFYYQPEPEPETNDEDEILDLDQLNQELNQQQKSTAWYYTIPSQWTNGLLTKTNQHKYPPTIIESISENDIDVLEIDETSMKNNKEYFMEVLHQKNFLIIKGDGGTGKDYSVNKHIPDTTNLTAFNSLARDCNGSTIHSFLGFGIDGERNSRIKDKRYSHINLSDVGLYDERLLPDIIVYIQGRIDAGLTTTATIDIRHQLPDITQHNAKPNTNMGLNQLLKMATVVEYKQQERITDIDDKRRIEEITKLLDNGNDPYQTLKEYIETWTSQQVIQRFIPNQDIIITQTNDRRDFFNQQIIKQYFGGKPYAKGMIMLYNGDNDKKLQVFKKDEFEIMSIDTEYVKLKHILNSQNEITCSISEIDKNYIYNFTSTTYSIQGKTIRKGRTFIDDPSHPLLSYDGKSAIVAITRNIKFDNNILIKNDNNYDMFRNGYLIIPLLIEYHPFGSYSLSFHLFYDSFLYVLNAFFF